MKRRQFLKGALYGTGGLAVTLGGFGTLTKLDPRKVDAAEKDSDLTVYSSCEMCRNSCQVAIRVKNGKVVKVDGNPYAQGVVCARGNSAPALLYDPQRIKKPMIRTGERGTGKFKEVSWDEAYQYIADKLKKVTGQYGPESVVLASRKGPHDWFFRAIGQGLGTPNLFSHEATCPMSRTAALELTMGTGGIAADYGNTKYLISMGRNWFEGIKVPEAQAVMKALNNGTKLVVLDPRFSVTASKGEWIPVKPATELAFVMAMANILITENLYDKAFIDQYTAGFDKWVEEVKDKTPEWAEKETGISKDKIIEITRAFAAAAPQAILDFGWRCSLTTNDYQLRRAIIIVNMMIGNYEVPGGYYEKKNAGVLKKYPSQAGYAIPLGAVSRPPFPKPDKNRIDGTGVKGTPGQLIVSSDGAVGQIPLTILSEKPYPLKAWLIHRFNPIISMPETEKTIEAIKKLDLVVTCDLYMTDTAYYSDVVLPECTYMERYEQIFDMSSKTPNYVLRQPAISPVYPDTKPASQIYKELAEKLGLGQYFNYKNMEDYLDQQLTLAGLTLNQMKEKGHWTPPGMKPFFVRANDPSAPITFKTPSKKIEIFSSEIEEATKEGIPVYKQHPQPKAGEFRFVQGKVAIHTNVGTMNIPMLNDLMPTNSLWINTESAAKLGIKNKDNIIVSWGKYQQKGMAIVTEGIRPDTVFAYHGFGRISPELKRAYGKGINDNDVISGELGIVGNSVTSMTFVTVQKA